MKWRVTIQTTHEVVVDEPDMDAAKDHAYDVVRDGNAGFGDQRIVGVEKVGE